MIPESPLAFHRRRIRARLVTPDGRLAEKPVEIRTDPVTGRTCRITFARAEETEAGAGALPPPPPAASDREHCPFCRPGLAQRTPRLPEEFAGTERLIRGASVLFPNLFPYGRFSAVSLFDDRHFVEIGTATADTYADSFINCRNYLEKVLQQAPDAVFTAVTQNHLPSAGGSLVHPHLQVHADASAPNFVRFLVQRAGAYRQQTGRLLFSDYSALETDAGERFIGETGDWQWLAAFAPEGFFEIWAILPGTVSLLAVTSPQWFDLARGVIRVQRFFRSQHRNGYNLGLVAVETPQSRLELRLRMVVRANHAPWARNDHTGYEVMLGDMATFTAPEETARLARACWK